MRAWVRASSALAPVVLIGGWSVAQTRQPEHYDAVRDTISALAARGAHDPWIMTAGLAALGACHLATAAGFTEAGPPARVVLAVGGAATIAVAVAAQPSAGHVPAAAIAFVALSVWAATARGPLRRPGRVLSALLLALLAWFGFALHAGDLVGLSERVLAGSQALVPLVLVVITRRRRKWAASHARNMGSSTVGR